MTRRSGHRRAVAAGAAATVLIGVLAIFGGSSADAAEPLPQARVSNAVRDRIARNGTANVVATLRTSVPLAPAPDDATARDWETSLGRAARAFAERAPDGVEIDPRSTRGSRRIAAQVDQAGLERLVADPSVESVTVNEWRNVSLKTSASTIGAPLTWSAGYTGAGQTIAVIDTGVQANHPMLNGRVVDGACFSGASSVEPNVFPVCPGGAFTGTGVASAAPCTGDDWVTLHCGHGTHVAGIAAGSNGPAEAPSGIAPGAGIIAIQVFTRLTNMPAVCGPIEPQCISAADVDVYAALDWVLTHAVTHHIAAANLSLGGGGFPTDCDASEPVYAALFDLLRDAGVAPVVASGNDGWFNAISAPACVSSAVAVGSIDTATTQVSVFSNVSPSLDLLAPGARLGDAGIHSSLPGSTYGAVAGTSMAAPHVAGAWALLREAYGNISVDQAETLLESTGRTITDVEGEFPLVQLDEAIPRPKGTYHAVNPSRLLDTREGLGAPRRRVGAKQSIDLQVGGRGGVPANGVSAVVLNVTYVSPSSFGFVTVFPTGALRPTASNLNLNPGDARPNLVTVRMGANGKVSLYNEAGTVDLVADVAGWYDTEAANNGSYYHPASPTRVLDTRIGRGAPQAKVGPGGELTIDVTDIDPARSPVPDGADAVVVNVVGTGATAGTHVTAYPAGVSPPLASNLNLGPGQTRPNLAMVPLDEDGNLTLRNNAGTIDLIADIQGWYDGDDSGFRFVPKSPARILDSRFGNGRVGPLGPDQSFALQVTGRGNVPTSGVKGAVINVTSTGVTLGGFVTVYPADLTTPPLASNLNLEIGKDIPNLVMTRLPSNGRARMYNAVGQVHLIGDVAGWFVD